MFRRSASPKELKFWRLGTYPSTEGFYAKKPPEYGYSMNFNVVETKQARRQIIFI